MRRRLSVACALLGAPAVAFLDFDDSQKKAAAAVAAGFVGLLSLFNIGGRFFWASISDRLGRKTTYAIMLALGAVMFGAVANGAATAAILGVFVLSFAVTTSMYGGGFATVPAYLADVFGTQFVGAIHGRLLTAWSTAGVLGPFIVTVLRDKAIAANAPRAGIYPPIFLILAGLLVVGFLANLMVRPVSERWHMGHDEASATASGSTSQGGGIGRGRFDGMTAIAWALVVLPLAWGVWITLTKAAVLFH